MDRTSIIVEDYYTWLLESIDEHFPGDISNYSILFEKLFNTEFYAVINKDENRIADGLQLRNIYSDMIGEHLYYLISELPKGCSIFEMMIALARRWDEDVMFDPDKGNRTGIWFYIMLENLGLDIYDDYYYDEDIVDEILRNLLNRRYRKDGRGGLFYTKNDRIDMRKIEIWYQINLFFNEDPELENSL